MSGSLTSASSSFADRLANTLQRANYRCALTPRDKDLVRSLREMANKRQRSMHTDPAADLLQEMYHDLSDYWDIMIYLGSFLISTIRIHVGQGERAIFPSLSTFDDVLRPYLRAGRVIIDPTRMAAKLEIAREVPEAPYLTLRAAWLAAEHFHGDVILATCKREHQNYYRLGFGFEPLCLPRPSFDQTGDIVCLALDVGAHKAQVEARYPQFQSSECERQRLFGDFDGSTASNAPVLSRAG